MPKIPINITVNYPTTDTDSFLIHFCYSYVEKRRILMVTNADNSLRAGAWYT